MAPVTAAVLTVAVFTAAVVTVAVVTVAMVTVAVVMAVVAAAVATSAVGPTACDLALRPPTASRAVVRDGGNQALTRDEERPIAVNIAKLLEQLRQAKS